MRVIGGWIVPPEAKVLVDEWISHKLDCIHCQEACRYQDCALYCECGREIIGRLQASPHIEFAPD